MTEIFGKHHAALVAVFNEACTKGDAAVAELIPDLAPLSAKARAQWLMEAGKLIGAAHGCKVEKSNVGRPKFDGEAAEAARSVTKRLIGRLAEGGIEFPGGRSTRTVKAEIDAVTALAARIFRTFDEAEIDRLIGLLEAGPAE